MHLRRFGTRLTAGLLLALLVGGLLAGPAQVAAQRDNGLIGATTYESPEFGYEVEWDDPWVAEEDDTTSSRDGDSLSLTSDGAYLAIFGFGYTGDPAGAVEIIIETLEESAGDVEILDESGDDEMASAEVTFEIEGTEVSEYVEARPIGDGVTVVVTITTPTVLYDDELESANETIELDGDPIFASLAAGADDRNSDDADDTRARDDEKPRFGDEGEDEDSRSVDDDQDARDETNRDEDDDRRDPGQFDAEDEDEDEDAL